MLAFIGLAVLALAMPAVAAAKDRKRAPKVTVMTRNLYLGADLGPAIAADTICGAVDAGGQIINEVDATSFPERSRLLAREIAEARPDLVGLQEVALWRDQTTSDYTANPATHIRYDFLALLRESLRDVGGRYAIAVKQNEFDQELPADLDDDNATGSGPFGVGACGADIDGRLTMRDVILRRKGSKVEVRNPEGEQFEHRYSVMLGGAVPVDVERGWVSVDAKIAKTRRRRGARFRFVNTHLEAFGDPQIREEQARELFADGGPLGTKKQLILVGDLNSGGKRDRVGKGFTEPGDEGAYQALTRDFGLFNLGVRQTCCYPDVRASAIGDSRFDHTVDHVMVKPRIRQLRAYVTGDDPSLTTPSGLVASDHGGLVSKLKLRRRR